MANILFVHGSHSGIFSGAERVTLYTASQRMRSGDRAYIITNGAGIFEDKVLADGIETIHISFPVYANGNSLMSKFAFFIRAIAAVPKVCKIIYKKKIDIVYTSTRGGHVCGVIAGWLRKCKIIMHFHDYVGQRQIYSFLAGWMATQVVAISKAVLENIMIKGILEIRLRRKSSVVYNSVLLNDEVHTEIQDVEKKIMNCKNEDRTIFGIIGQIAPWKGQLDFIEAAEVLLAQGKKACFFIVGSPLDERMEIYNKILQEKVKNSQWCSCYYLIPRVENIGSIYQSIDVVVMPSKNEPFGLVALEAMGWGKPVVAYASGGLCEVVLHNQNGMLVAPDDIVGLVSAMELLMKNEGLRNHLGQNGKRNVREKYSQQRYDQEMELIFQAVKKATR